MKSLLITFDFPPIVSGISTVFYNIWKYLLNEEYIILAPWAKGSKKVDSYHGKKVYRLYMPVGNNIFKKIARAFLVFLYCGIIIKKENIKILFCGQPMIIGFVGLIFKKQFKISYHVWVYGGEIIKFKKNKLLLNLLRTILRNADKVITNSFYTTRVFFDFGIEKEKLVQVNPAVDTEQFKPRIDVADLIKRFNLENRRVIMTVGRLVPRKGNDTVIKSLKTVLKKIPDIVYLIVGDGPNRQNLGTLVRDFELEDYVIFAGLVNDEDLPRYYNLCELYLLPNRETEDFDTIEGFGLTFLEANACGKPVIGGKSGGTSDSVLDGMTGILVDPEDTEIVANKIIEILSNKELAKKLGSNGRQRVLENFRWKISSKVVEGLVSDYNKR